jgi:hypothetical protein
MLRAHGASSVSNWEEGNHAGVTFCMNAIWYRLDVEIPSKDDPQFKYTPARRFERTKEQQLAEWEQAVRTKWRDLALVVKALVVGIESGIFGPDNGNSDPFMKAFTSFIVLPNQRTVGEHVLPQIQETYITGKMPAFRYFPEPKGDSTL